MVKEDCFAYREEKQECNCLKELYCKNEECNFYKTREQARQEQGKYILNKN